MSRRIPFGMLSLLLTLGLLLGGCSKITKANYDKIEVGMTYEAVVNILGSPDETQDVMGTRSCAWGKAPKIISIKFIADKVVFHSAKGLK